MGKEAEPSVSRFVCAARKAFLRAEGENGRTEKESESKNPNKLPKDSTECEGRSPSSLDLPRPLLSIKLSRRNLIPGRDIETVSFVSRVLGTENRIGEGEKKSCSLGFSIFDRRSVNFSNHGENTTAVRSVRNG